MLERVRLFGCLLAIKRGQHLDLLEVPVPGREFFDIGKDGKNFFGCLLQDDHARVLHLGRQREADGDYEREQKDDNAEEASDPFHSVDVTDRASARQ